MSFEAKYHSTCAESGDAILPGQIVESVGNGYRHVVCPDDEALSVRPGETPCTDCFMLHRPGQTECES